MKRRAFTWIEAVVVVAILMIGAAIIFPIPRGARENARRSSCQSNLKQIGLAFIQYARDYDATAPPVVNARGAWSQLLVPYIKSPAIYQCPSTNFGETGATDYFFNARLAGARNTLNLYRDNKPTSFTILCGEGADNQDAAYNLSQFPGAWRKDESSPAWRHLDTGNYLFVDGHAKSYRAEKFFGAREAATPTFAVK